MAELVPQPFATLLRRIVEEPRRQGGIFDLPQRAFFRPRPDLDLSVLFHGERAGNAAGPAAGPHSQLAQNIVLSWLAGARIIELKTVQINDRLQIPRPCIDVENVGFNVEWSQELRLEESLAEYVSAWVLIHILKQQNPVGAPPASLDTLFDMSVGYDLAGIRSDRVAHWIDGLSDAAAAIERLRSSLPRELRKMADVDVPPRVASCITLSTFHGCPADEIERIVEHLFTRHATHVVVKLNPTLLGLSAVETILRKELGYEELQLDATAFEKDLKWDDALSLFRRLEVAAARAGRTLGAKFTNTLVVRNHKGRLPGETMYLSGQPLHVLALALADKFSRATDSRYGISFSAGIDAQNFHRAVACGMVPVTTCTDLLRTGGYARLPKYLTRLETEMMQAGARTVPEWISACAAKTPRDAGSRRAESEAAATNLAAYARQVLQDPRYHARQNRGRPRKVGSHLELLDCLSCNKCVPVCPNDALFVVETGKVDTESVDLVRADEGWREVPARFRIEKPRQWIAYADFCNDCGNCDVFCPEDGGPFAVKPRFFGSRATFDAAAPADGLFLEEGGRRMAARLAGVSCDLTFEGDLWRYREGSAEVIFDLQDRRVATHAEDVPRAQSIALWRYQVLRRLRAATLAQVNPVSCTERARLPLDPSLRTL